MAMDTAGVGLQEAPKMDWENYNPGSKFQVPPPAEGSDGKRIKYFAQLPNQIGLDVSKDGYRQFLLDPIKLVKTGNGSDGYVIRFTRASVKKFVKADGTEINASVAGNVLRASGVMARPQSNSEYEAAFNLVKGKIAPITLDWFAYNKDTGERIQGYRAFPDDPTRPGTKKAVLKKGDSYNLLDTQGNVIGQGVVKSEVLFANAQIKYFLDPTRG